MVVYKYMLDENILIRAIGRSLRPSETLYGLTISDRTDRTSSTALGRPLILAWPNEQGSIKEGFQGPTLGYASSVVPGSDQGLYSW